MAAAVTWLIPVASVIGVAFAIFLWYIVSKVRMDGGGARGALLDCDHDEQSKKAAEIQVNKAGGGKQEEEGA